jgi:hypothetical protein
MTEKNIYTREINSEKPDEAQSRTKQKKEFIEAILSATLLPREHAGKPESKISGIVVGKIIDAREKEAPKVDFQVNFFNTAIPALSTVPITPGDIGRDVALGFMAGDPQQPIILGFMHHVSFALDTPEKESQNSRSKMIIVEKDDETVTISADKKIVLKCGESSITLTREGKVLLNGGYISSSSTGVTRIRGGAIQIN